MLTKQEILDKVWKHFVVEKNLPSVEIPANPVCFYRGPKGTKCAIGILIPDHLYDPKMENGTVVVLLKTFPQLIPILGADTNFLVEIQQCHDYSARKNDFHKEIKIHLRNVAIDHNLAIVE